jgi:hypothetical protein
VSSETWSVDARCEVRVGGPAARLKKVRVVPGGIGIGIGIVVAFSSGPHVELLLFQFGLDFPHFFADASIARHIKTFVKALRAENEEKNGCCKGGEALWQ